MSEPKTKRPKPSARRDPQKASEPKTSGDPSSASEPKTTSDPPRLNEPPPHVVKLRNAVRFMYDLQQLRIQGGNRGNRAVTTSPLDEHDKQFMEKMSGGLETLEKDTLKEIKLHLKAVPVSRWLLEQKGIGPTLAGVIASEIDITRCNTVSQLWAFSGLHVVEGHAARRRKGQKANWNPFLRAKLLKVLGDCLIKANSPWRKFYDDYKHRKQHTLVDVCMACNGDGKARAEVEERPASLERADVPQQNQDDQARRGGRETRRTEASRDDEENRNVIAGQCRNCKGTGGPAPWGRSDAHRHTAAVRYMVKMLLAQLWEEWRTLEGLPCRPSYAEEYLGRAHHERLTAHRICNECGTKRLREEVSPKEWRLLLEVGLCLSCAEPSVPTASAEAD